MRRHCIEDCFLSLSLSVSKNLSADKSYFSAVVFQGMLIRPLRRINEEKAISTSCSSWQSSSESQAEGAGSCGKGRADSAALQPNMHNTQKSDVLT